MLESILITGFGPFGHHGRNISEEAVKRLDGAELPEGVVLRALALPVQLERATAALEEALEAEQPAAVIACGIHADGPAFRLELSAKNERHYPIPDADGQQVHGQPVEAGGPPMVFSTLPVAAIKQELEEAGLPVELSDDAGRYLCNAIFYWTARRVSPAGFLHVPAAVDRVDDVVQAVRLAAQVTARRLAAQRVEATA